ncbi:MAG: hypothetical protein U0166_10650 [Acidobacteriota bacterium]
MLRSFDGRVTIDMGTGDGCYPYAEARRDLRRFFVGMDASHAALAITSRQAARKPARGGAPNALFVRAAVEALPSELDGAADRLSVMLPWGSLLRAVLGPDVPVLRSLRRLCQEKAALGGRGDRFRAGHRGALAARDRRPVRRGSSRPSRETTTRAGFALDRVEPADLAAIPTTWARRLAHEAPRSRGGSTPEPGRSREAARAPDRACRTARPCARRMERDDPDAGPEPSRRAPGSLRCPARGGLHAAA